MAATNCQSGHRSCASASAGEVAAGAADEDEAPAGAAEEEEEEEEEEETACVGTGGAVGVANDAAAAEGCGPVESGPGTGGAAGTSIC